MVKCEMVFQEVQDPKLVFEAVTTCNDLLILVPQIKEETDVGRCVTGQYRSAKAK